MPRETTGVVKNPLNEGQGDLHRQLALFLLACYRSEHGDSPHKVEIRWMAGVIRRISSQRNQMIGYNAQLLETCVREELDRMNTPGTDVDAIISWSYDRLRAVQDLPT